MRRRASFPGLLASSCLFAAGWAASTQVAAQSPRIYSVTVPVEIEHDSNPNMDVGPHPSTTWFRVKPSITAAHVRGNDEYTVEGGLSAEKSSNASVAKDRLDPRLSGQWKHLTALSTTQLALLLDRRAIRSLDIREQQPIGVDGSRTLISLSGSYTRELNERTSTKAELRQEWERYSVAVTPDYRRTVGAVRVTRRVDERRSWHAAANGQLYRADPLPGAVGRQRSNVVGAQVGFSQQFTETLRGEVGAGPMRFTSPRSDTDWQAYAKADYAGERWTSGVELSRAPGVNNTAGGGLLVSETARIQSRYAVNPLTHLDLNAGVSRERAAGSRRALAAVALVRQLSPVWELSVKVTRNQHHGRIGNPSSNLVGVQLVYRNTDF